MWLRYHVHWLTLPFLPPPTEFRTNKPSDVISTLVSIYDSKDLFVKELQVLLAQRLLAIKDGNFERVEKEVNLLPFGLLDNELTLVPGNQRRNIEILKIRFGEAALQVCEVMLKDMTDSKRIDGHVQSQKAVCCSILSSKVGSWCVFYYSQTYIRQLYQNIFGLRLNQVTWSCPDSSSSTSSFLTSPAIPLN